MSAFVDRTELRHARGATSQFAGRGALDAALAELGELLAGRRVFALVQPPVAALHGGVLDRIAERVGELRRIDVPDGEAAKTVSVADRIWRELSVQGARRDSLVLAFGGGSVGDLAGFVAGTFARGLGWLQLPSTLLAQVDASIGGKCAVDLPEAKNAVGLFHHPLAVIAESDFLATLPEAELRCGLAEVVKMAALLDLDLLERVENELPKLLGGESDALAPVVVAAIRAKTRVVESDPEETSGRRALLNFGHTLGHALEAEIGYGRIAHGDAVVHGLRFALALSVARGGDAAFAARVARLLDRLGSPALPPLAAARLLERIGRDKKAVRSGAVWVLAQAAGEGRIDRDVPSELVAAELEKFLGARAGRPL
jgi:3-dehydroquinate synthase